MEALSPATSTGKRKRGKEKGEGRGSDIEKYSFAGY